MKTQFMLLVLGLIAGLMTHSSALAATDQTVLEQKSKLLGRELSVRQEYGSVPSGKGVQTVTQVQFIGTPKPLLDARVEYVPPVITSAAPAATPQDPLSSLITNTKHDFYVSGIRIWSDEMGYKDGSLFYSGGVAPTSIPIPVLTYPIGPLVLELDAGVEFEAQLLAKLTPSISFPFTDSSLAASLSAEAAASGFVEGSARILVIRAGIGGAINIVQGDASVGAVIFFKKQAPELTYGGKVSVLSGKIYAFVDTNILFGIWTHLWSANLYAWNGKCWAFGAESCAVN